MRVARVAGECRVLAVQQLRAGESVLTIEGETTDRPSRYSIQIEERVHIEVGKEHSLDEALVRYPWRFLNHSCNPNTIVRGREVAALRKIPKGTEVTFNYNTTEFDMAIPFACRCGSPNCAGQIRGFRHLPASERERLRPLLAEHLRRRLESGRPPASLTVPA